MRLKKATAVLLTAAIVLSGASNVFVYAAEEASQAESTATIKFKDGGTTGPVDPEEPDIDGPGPGTGNEGDLTIDYISSFFFGEQDTPSRLTTYKLVKTEEEKSAPRIQVTDKRGSKAGSGWEVQASITKQFQDEDANTTLNGSQLILTTGHVTTTTDNGTTGVPTATKEIILDSTGNISKKVIEAADGQGAGIWLSCWYDLNTGDKGIRQAVGDGLGKVELKVPANSATITGKDVRATVTWTLTTSVEDE